MTTHTSRKRVIPLYILRGGDWSIAHSLVATRLDIDELGPAIPPETTALARGRIWLTDFMEDTRWQNDWHALWTLPEREIVTSGGTGIDAYRTWYRKLQAKERLLGWRVMRAESSFPDFTAANNINQAIAMFIALHCCWYAVHMSPGTPLPRIRRQPAVYKGPMQPYTEICLCGVLGNSGLHPKTPFPWENVTKGQFPKRCFECSCGRQWWEIDPKEHQWIPVGDVLAWKMLTRHNGEPIRQLGIYEGTVRLLGPLVRRGMIPLPPALFEPELKIIVPK